MIIRSSSGSSGKSNISLPAYFDLLLEGDAVKKIEMERCAIHEKKKSSYDLTKKVIEYNLLLGQKEKGMEMLLETPSDHPNYYVDALKAAIISATISPKTFQDTVKIIATNMIANGNVDEGVQLLCLIGKSMDACRYLQTYDRWTDAVWLAKISLSEPECSLIMKRWADFLYNTNQKMKAVHVLLTLGEFHRALQILHESQNSDLAALFAASCPALSTGLPSKSELQQRGALTESGNMNKEIPMEQLLQSIHLDYGFFLHHLGNITAAESYWTKAGSAGDNMIETVRAVRL